MLHRKGIAIRQSLKILSPPPPPRGGGGGGGGARDFPKMDMILVGYQNVHKIGGMSKKRAKSERRGELEISEM